MGREEIRMKRISVVEDDIFMREELTEILRRAGYDAESVISFENAARELISSAPDLVLLDLNLPFAGGFQICRELKQKSGIPVLILTSRDQMQDELHALDLGADDYLQKPFGTIELLARIRTALRHTRTALEDDSIALKGSYEVGDLLIDYRKCRVYLAGKDVGLTPNEFRIVALLGKHAGQVITYRTMLKELWGPYASRDNKILRVHMANIRRKIEPNPDEPRDIFTEVGIGYRMSEE